MRERERVRVRRETDKGAGRSRCQGATDHCHTAIDYAIDCDERLKLKKAYRSRSTAEVPPAYLVESDKQKGSGERSSERNRVRVSCERAEALSGGWVGRAGGGAGFSFK